MASDLLDRVFEQDVNQVARAAHELPRAQQALLRLFDGTRTLAGIVAASPLGPADTFDAVARLGARGFVRPRAKPSEAKPDGAAFNDLEEAFFAREPAHADDATPAPRRLLTALLRR